MEEGGFVVTVEEAAYLDLELIHGWLSEHHPEEARWLRRELRAAIRSLDQMPSRCPLAPTHKLRAMGLRRLLVGKYFVLFRIREREVEVLRVMHSARWRRH